ncbi:hypothetical protein N7489_009339 [Penicillium chrysogenum]|uniref:Signaling mucin n=1 Tax=Penicillium chrysogenum TaxID=5076 RepID=A0ABQ8WXH7_PENCH|nr:uncharacterized protein N7489_009339 [Penicillium chrysogenum]KAJ5228631.1 hypothetical protein N7489_009339 [Penicillium chrysogenum]KAJ5283737.1 hypothetical protein N7505_001717 [Penicillium chrysogenum]
MRPDAISVLAAFLAVGGLEFVAAQDAPEAHVQRPRWYFPQDVKRTIRRNAELEPGSILDSVFDNLAPTQVSSSTAIPTPETSAPAQPQKGQEVVVVTISVDPKNPEITHRITGTTTIGGEPTGTTTTTTQKTEGSSTENTSKKSSEAASTDAGTTSKQGSVVDSSAKASTASPSTTTSSDGLLGDLGLDVGSLLGGDSSSSTATTSSAATISSTATPVSDSSAKVTSPASSTPAAPSSDGLLGDLTSGLGGLFGESTTNSSVSATPTGSSVNRISSAASSTTSSGSDLLDLLGLGDKSSTGNSTSATMSSDASSSPTIPISVPASATSPPSTTATGTTTSGDFLGGLVSGVDSLLGVTSTGTGSTALIPTASLPNLSLLPSKSTGLIPGQGGTNTGAIPTPTKSLPSIPVPHSPGSDSTSTSVSETVSGSNTASAPLLGTTTASVPGSGSHESSRVPTPTSHPVSTPLPSSTSTSEEVSTAKTSVEPQTPTETPTPSTSDDNDWMPSTILIVPTTTATESSTSGETAEPTAPPSLPGSITPSNEVTEPPSDSILLQLGFNSQLPWSFVATTPLSSSQIFNYTPQAIENALPTLSAKDGPVMFAIEPYYNWQSTGYNATLAIFYFPRDKVDALKALKVNPNSALYNQASESIQSLMTMVDPTIPLEFSGNYPSGDSDSTGANNHGGSDDGSDNGNNENTDGSAGSSKAKASSVGIGVGVVAGAAAYGAGMFWVARRYRKRKQLHQRSSSTVEQMSQGGSAAGSMFAAGGRAPSHGSRGTARSQMISAPVMAENSLGWN